MATNTGVDSDTDSDSDCTGYVTCTDRVPDYTPDGLQRPQSRSQEEGPEPAAYIEGMYAAMEDLFEMDISEIDFVRSIIFVHADSYIVLSCRISPPPNQSAYRTRSMPLQASLKS